MTKAEIVANISDKLGIEKVDVQLTVESLMQEIINSLENGEKCILERFWKFHCKEKSRKDREKYKKEHHNKNTSSQYPSF